MDLKDYREQMDSIDAELLSLFARRMDLSAQIAAWKGARGLPVRDEARERDKLRDIAMQSPEGLAAYAQGLYETIFALSRRYQSRILHREEK